MDIDHLRMTLVWPLRVTNVASQRDLDEITSIVTKDEVWKLREDPLNPVFPDRYSPVATRYAEFVYFHPFVRRFLYESRTEKSPMRTLERDDVKYLDTTVAVDLEGWSLGLPTSKEIRFQVHSIRLHLFRTGVIVLAVELSTGRQSLAVVQSALDQVRRAYRPYFEKWKDEPDSYKAGHCPVHARWADGNGPCGLPSNYDDLPSHLSPVWKELDSAKQQDERQPPFAAHWDWLLPCFGNDRRYLHLLDERIPAMAFIAVKDPAQFTDGDFFRLGYLDDKGPSTTLPYSTEFFERFKRQATYDRFWDPLRPGHGWMNTRYLTMGYSFVMIGSSYTGPGRFFMDDEAGALAHFRNHYYQLFLIAHFQHASLINFSHDLAILVDDLAQTGVNQKKIFQDMDELRTRFADFVSRFWFDEISNQMQARELFDLIRKNLGTDRLYADVTNEIKNVAEVIGSRMQARIGNITLWFILATGFLGLMNLTKLRDAFVWWANGNPYPVPRPSFADWQLEGILAVILIGVAMLIHHFTKLPTGRK